MIDDSDIVGPQFLTVSASALLPIVWYEAGRISAES